MQRRDNCRNKTLCVAAYCQHMTYLAEQPLLAPLL